MFIFYKITLFVRSLLFSCLNQIFTNLLKMLFFYSEQTYFETSLLGVDKDLD